MKHFFPPHYHIPDDGHLRNRTARPKKERSLFRDDEQRHGVREAIIKPIIDANQFAASEESN